LDDEEMLLMTMMMVMMMVVMMMMMMIEQISYECENDTAHSHGMAFMKSVHQCTARSFLIQSQCWDTTLACLYRKILSSIPSSSSYIANKYNYVLITGSE
jgi:competence protein ComGC